MYEYLTAERFHVSVDDGHTNEECVSKTLSARVENMFITARKYTGSDDSVRLSFDFLIICGSFLTGQCIICAHVWQI